MKKIAPVILIITLVLSSCAKEDVREELLSIRTKFLDAESLSLSADIREELSDRRYVFSVDYAGNAETGSVTITKPEEIGGISVSFGEDGRLALEYDDISLIVPGLYDENLSPAAVVPFVIKAICSAYINECHVENLDGKECISAELDCGEAEDGDKITCTVWFFRDGGGLARAECSAGGRTLVYIDF